MAKYKPMNLHNIYPSYRGGDTIVNPQGYIMEYCPGHPLQNFWGWVAQHRLIGEDIIGRPLIQSSDLRIAECVHHVDHNRLNNSKDNLIVLNALEHQRYHARIAAEKTKTPICEDELREAIKRTGTIKGAAKELGCHHMTIQIGRAHV